MKIMWGILKSLHLLCQTTRYTKIVYCTVNPIVSLEGIFIAVYYMYTTCIY